jgi:hypothetical protein
MADGTGDDFRLEVLRSVRRILADAESEVYHLVRWLEHNRPKPTPTRAVVTITGGIMGAPTITVDTTGLTATLGFEDDHGDAADAPAGSAVSWSVDDTAVLTVAPDATNPFEADLTVVAEGTANLSATLTGAFEADGVTPIANPAAVALNVGAGPAEQAVVTLAD